MFLWITWWNIVWQLRPAFSRGRTFLWAAVILAGFSTRKDLLGIASFMRSQYLKDNSYHRIRDFFHSNAVKLNKLTQLWIQICLSKLKLNLVIYNERIVLVADGIKNPKEGRKMPGVKSLHQESTNNSKPEFIMGHSCQCVSVLVKAINGILAIPLVARIHEGVKFTNRDKRTVIDKMRGMINEFFSEQSFYFLGGAYYACRAMGRSLLSSNNHLVTRVRSNAVANMLATKTSRPGRPKIYGKKLKLSSIFDNRIDQFTSENSSLYDDNNIELKWYSLDLLWRPIGKLVRFVWVIHPTRGRCILMSTDLELGPMSIIHLYGFRFKIEVSFKSAVHTMGTFAYRFWMKVMHKTKKGQGDVHLHHETPEYRESFKLKMRAYEIHIQLGIIAQGILNYLSINHSLQIWSNFNGWMRTMKVDKSPSESVVAQALQSSMREFLQSSRNRSIFKKFLEKIVDYDRFLPFDKAV